MSNPKRLDGADLKCRFRDLWKYRHNDFVRGLLRMYLRERDPNPDALCVSSLPGRIKDFFNMRDDYVASPAVRLYLKYLLVECDLANGESFSLAAIAEL